MSHMTCHDCLVGSQTFDGSMFIFMVCVKNCRVCISSLDMIGHGMTWQRILLLSNRIHMGLTSMLTHAFT